MLLLAHALRPHIERDDKAKIQGCNRIHGLISFQKTGDRRALGIVAHGRPSSPLGMQQAADKNCQNQKEQPRAEQLAQPVGQLIRFEGHQQGNGEKEHRVGCLRHGIG